VGDPRWSSLFLKDRSLWKGPMQRHVVKSCTPWKGPTLGQFVKSYSPWEGLTLEKSEENCLQ